MEAGALGQWAASQIGAAYADPTHPLDPISHKFAHAALGAATGALMGGTGCVASGAMGAVVAELAVDIMHPDKPLAQMKQKEQDLGRKLTRQEFYALYPAVHQGYFEDVRNVHKIAKVTAAIAASFIGGNTALGAATGANAIDYNAAFAAGLGVSVFAETAFAGYLADGLALVGGAVLGAGGAVLIKEALDFIGVKTVNGGYAYRGHIYASLPDALAAVMMQNPLTQRASSMYVVAKALLDLNHKSGLDLQETLCKDRGNLKISEKPSNGDAHQAKAPCVQSHAATGGAMPPPEDPDDEGRKEKFTLPKSQEELRKFINNADRKGSAQKADTYHRVASFGSSENSMISVSDFVGGDGNKYYKLLTSANVNNTEGVIEYIVNTKGEITHQLFRIIP